MATGVPANDENDSRSLSFGVSHHQALISFRNSRLHRELPMITRVSSPSRSRATNTSLVQNASRDGLLWRATFLMLLVTTVMSCVVLRLAYLQIIQGSHNRELAEQNRIRLIPLPSERGNILDRHGKLLASSRLSRSVYLWPRQQSPQQWQLTAQRLSQILKVPPQEIIARLEQTGYDSPMPVRVVQQITPEIFVALAEQAPNLPGVEIFVGSARHYPHGNLAAHLIGYIGEATAEDMAKNPDYPMGMIVGQAGVERLANTQIEGVWGSRLIEVDAHGREKRLLGVRSAQPGNDVTLTLDPGTAKN
ncbi:MAG: hypothetical protein HC881_05230, partial [Leptolyngbyaceae cyanobacterium SL_7_1]|nr:hypothetical protein [Leptolyngbyaceae cyanobacterium SL_7_1]